MFTAAWLCVSFTFAFIFRTWIYSHVRHTRWYNTYYFYFIAFQLYFSIHDVVNCVRYEILHMEFLSVPIKYPADMPQGVIEELQLSTFLKFISCVCPFAVITTIFITFRHMWAHHQCIKAIENRLSESDSMEHVRSARYPHDLSILVLLLPLVYSLMAFKSLTRMWMLITATVYTDYGSYLTMRELIYIYYDTNYFVADLYEAVGLWSFSRLCVGSVRNTCMDTQWGEHAKKLFYPLKKMTLFGVESFVCTYFIIAAYHLFLSITDSVGYHVCDRYPFVCSLNGYTTGAGFLASSLALYNILQFEHCLEFYLTDFKPFFKFWGAKILVSLAFLQDQIIIILFTNMLDYYSDVQGKVLYSSLMCIECTAVAIMHTYAWNIHEDWYTNDYWTVPLDARDLDAEVQKMMAKKTLQSLEEPLLKAKQMA